MDNLVVIVTGGSRGLGRAIVEMLLLEGAFVSTCSREDNGFIKQMQKKYPEQFYWESVDLSSPKAVTGFVNATYKMCKKIDVLINNAAIAHGAILSIQPLDEISDIIDINLKGTIYFIRSVLKYFLAKQHGIVINISSIVGQQGYSGLSVYSATKAALDGLTRSLARELGTAHIRINSIAPGYMETQMSASLTTEKKEQIIRRTPLGRLGEPADILGCIQYLLSDKAQFVTGQIFTIDGGINC